MEVESCVLLCMQTCMCRSEMMDDAVPSDIVMDVRDTCGDAWADVVRGRHVMACAAARA